MGAGYMNEKMLCTEIVTSLNKIPNTLAWKIPDTSPKLRTIQKFIPARAFDIMCCHNSVFVAFEVKHQKGPYSISIKRFTEFEVRCMLAVEAAGGAAYAAIGWWYYPTQRQMDKYDLDSREKKLTLIRADVLFRKLSFDTMSYTELLDMGETITYKRGWDLRRFLHFLPSDEAWSEFKVREASRNGV
jgi:hypothetical protein